MKKTLFILLSLFSLQGFALDTYFCNENLGTLPIQQGGRVKPLSVHAKESIKHLIGKTSFEDLKATTLYCLLSLEAFGMVNNLNLEAKLEHKDTKALLASEVMKYKELSSRQAEIRQAWMKIKDDSSYKKDLGKLLSKISLYEDITSGGNWLLAQGNEQKEITWIPINIYLDQTKIEKLAKEGISDPFTAVIENSRFEYIKAAGDKFMTEYYFDKATLTGFAMLFTLIALASLVLFKRFNIALVFSVITIITQFIYISLRVYISGRAPITNMYETVIFSGFGALVLAMGIGHFKKEKIYVYMGLAYNMCTLMMITFAGSMVSPNISPLVPVLRDNFWLSTHVTTIILSYGALALSWILSNTIIIKKKFFTLTKTDESYYNDITYTSLKYGVTMLAAGIILGGVWADYSWGRFWGWDPKETWSLIVLCIYMAILHGKYTNWINEARFAHLVAGSFMSVMMAWFGVNFILASGLHSYGFSEGGAIFLGSFFLVQIAILVITYDFKKEKEA